VAQHLAAVNVGASGSVNASGGDLNVAGSAINNGTINIPSGRAANFSGNVTGSGNYTGLGTANFLANFSTGNGPAQITFGGKMTLAPTSTLSIELGGNTIGSQYDSLFVTNQLSLAGTLAVSFINPGAYLPAAGDSFTILHWASIVGAFSSQLLPSLPGGLTWDASQLYTSGKLSIAGLFGDYNLNGTVDAADYVLWRKTLNQSGSGLVADGDGDHQITQADFDIWRAHFGQSAGGSGSMFGGAIPEPASCTYVAVWVLALINRRRSRAKSR
jgi:hypothetical protein